MVFRAKYTIVLAVAVFTAVLYFVLAQTKTLVPAQPSIKVGVIHSLSGTMARSEKPLVDMVQMAVDEINAKGGLIGRRVDVIVRDTGSSPDAAAKAAEHLIVQDGVDVLFGCWTSACRKSVKPVVERYRHILFYPLQYEGVEQSSHIVYTGAAPNQQIIPAGVWAMENLGKRVFLVGSDYVFPRMANVLLSDVVRFNGGEVVGEEYLALGSDDVSNVISAIKASGADVIMNTINGDTNITFFEFLASLEGDIPAVVSFSVSETELSHMPSAAAVEHYGAWNYFQSLADKENVAFVTRVQDRLGVNAAIGDPMESAYNGVYLWAHAVERAGAVVPRQVLPAIKRLSILGPGGIVSVDPITLHVWKTARIGRVLPSGQFEQVWSSERPVRPQPFPPYRSWQEWGEILSRFEGMP